MLRTILCVAAALVPVATMAGPFDPDYPPPRTAQEFYQVERMTAERAALRDEIDRLRDDNARQRAIIFLQPYSRHYSD